MSGVVSKKKVLSAMQKIHLLAELDDDVILGLSCDDAFIFISLSAISS